MSYDADSFKAGFALGRVLWRPPTLHGDQDTGLGWAADPKYLVYNAGTFLGTCNERRFTKFADGYAVAVYGDHYNGSWCGPLLISTNPNAVYTNYEQIYSYLMRFEYLGLNWYLFYGYHYQNASYTTPLFVWTTDGGSLEATAKLILQAAHVRVYRTGGTP